MTFLGVLQYFKTPLLRCDMPISYVVISVTRLGDFLDFGLLFKAFGNNYFVQISHIVTQYFVKVSKSIIFLVKSFLGNFYRNLAIFFLVTLVVM